MKKNYKTIFVCQRCKKEEPNPDVYNGCHHCNKSNIFQVRIT